MSVTKTQSTDYHSDDQDVKYRLKWVRLDGLSPLSGLQVVGGLVGRVGTTSGVVSTRQAASLDLDYVKANFSAAERQAGKLFLAACERELVKQVEELKDCTHVGTDVFVED